MSYNIGDHIKVLRPMGYTHHGIYVENHQVIHYVKAKDGDKSKGVIKQQRFIDFSEGMESQVVSYQLLLEQFMKKPPREIACRARSCLNEEGYNLVYNNCECFAVWCVTGFRISFQSLMAMGVVGGGVAVVVPIVTSVLASIINKIKEK